MHLLKEVLSFVITYISASKKIRQKLIVFRETCKASILMCHLICRVSRTFLKTRIWRSMGRKATEQTSPGPRVYGATLI